MNITLFKNFDSVSTLFEKTMTTTMIDSSFPNNQLIELTNLPNTLIYLSYINSKLSSLSNLPNK